MDFIDQLQALATKIQRQRDQIETEEATKTPSSCRLSACSDTTCSIRVKLSQSIRRMSESRRGEGRLRHHA